MDLVAQLRQEFGLTVELKDGRPVLDLSASKRVRWPRKIEPKLCVAIDPYGPEGHRWPLPRFEILIANLDSINFKGIAVGLPGDGQAGEKLMRVAADFSQKHDPLQQARVISECLLWIGHDTLWRQVAAAVGIPQIVIALNGEKSLPAYQDTIFVLPGSKPAESELLGPVGVAEVAEAVSRTLKRKAREPQ